MQPSPGGLTRTSRCPHGFFLAVTFFFCLVTVRRAPLRWAVRGGPTSTSPRWLLAEMAPQPRTLLSKLPCPRLFPPRHCRHSEFLSSLTSSLGSSHPFFVTLFHCDSRLLVSWESRALPAAAPCGHLLGELLGEPLRSLRLHQALTAPCLRLHAMQWDNLSSTAACPNAWSPL